MSSIPGPAAPFRCGRVAIVGRPNVGKSTLLNALVGEHISITAPRPQTTRFRVAGVITRPEAQFVLVDTPGFQTEHRSQLTRLLNRSVDAALADVDAIVWVVEALQLGAADEAVAARFQPDAPIVLAANKIDRLKDKSALLPWIAQLQQRWHFAAVVPLSAKLQHNTEELLKALQPLLPTGEAWYENDQLTDRSERFFAAEFVREQLFRKLSDEVPFATSVLIEEFEQQGELYRIGATIFVGKTNHKALVIGKAGAQLKEIASAARKRMEQLFGRKVFLQVWVKTKSGWVDDERALRELGYDEH